jgi:glycosyltransferase involved in cell wall biosynthesis
MKVLYLGNQNDQSGWGNSAKNRIKAIYNSDIPISIRSITFNGSATKEPLFLELEKVDLDGVTHCIQHVIPELYYYDGRYKNIGVCELETKGIAYSMWPKYMNMMDEIWVANQESLITCYSNGVIKPVKVVPHCIERPNFKRNVLANEIKIGFNFGFIGEFNSRKNIETLVKAFHLEFHPSEPVNLFLKLSGPTENKEYNFRLFNEMEEKIRQELNIRSNYKRIVVSFDKLPHEHLLSITSQLHTFVTASHGESCCIPAMDAASLGIPSIWPAGLGIDDYGVGTKVSSTIGPCSYDDFFLRNIYSGRDDWFNIDIHELCLAMRYHYEMPEDKRIKMSKECIEKIEPYYIENIGPRIKEVLND